MGVQLPRRLDRHKAQATRSRLPMVHESGLKDHWYKTRQRLAITVWPEHYQEKHVPARTEMWAIFRPENA